MCIRPLHLFDKVGAGGSVGEQDLSLHIGDIAPDGNAVVPYLKGDAFEDGVRRAVVLCDAKPRQLLIDEADAHRFARCDADGLDCLAVELPALDARDLAHLVGRGAQLVEDRSATRAGLFGVGRAARNILDLHRHTGKGLAGVAALLHAQIAAGGIFVCDNSGLAVQNGDVLRRLRRERVPFRRGDFLDRIMSHDVNRNRHGAVRAG